MAGPKMRCSNHLLFFTRNKNVLQALKDEQKRLHCQFRKENKELRELEMRIDSMNIQVHEPLPVGEGKSVCGHCHHLRHRKPSTETLFFEKNVRNIYTVVSRSTLNFSVSWILSNYSEKREKTVGHLESHLQSMEQFSTNSKHQFAKNLAPTMYYVDKSYKNNKPKFMRCASSEGKSGWEDFTWNNKWCWTTPNFECERLKQLHADDSPQSSVSGQSEEFSLVKISSRDNEVHSPSPAEKRKGYHETPVKRSLERQADILSSSFESERSKKRRKKRKNKSKATKARKRSREHRSSSEDSSSSKDFTKSKSKFRNSFFPCYHSGAPGNVMNNQSRYGGLPFSNVPSVPIPTNENSLPLPFRPAFGSVQTSQTNVQQVVTPSKS